MSPLETNLYLDRIDLKRYCPDGIELTQSSEASSGTTCLDSCPLMNSAQIQACHLVLEAASSSNTPRTIERIAHWRDLGFLAAVPLLIGALREGWATLSVGRVPHMAGGPIPVPEIPVFPIAIWPAGGFILLALLIAGWRVLEARRGAAP